MSRWLGGCGYRTKVITATGGPQHTYRAVIEYIRAAQIDFLADCQREGLEEDE